MGRRIVILCYAIIQVSRILRNQNIERTIKKLKKKMY